MCVAHNLLNWDIHFTLNSYYVNYYYHLYAFITNNNQIST